MLTRATELVSRVKKVPTRALEKSTRVKQEDNRVIKINTTRLERRPFVRKTKRHVMCVTYDVSCLISHRSID